MTEREPSLKKRRKGTSTTSSSSSKVPDVDVYKNVVEFEEAEASARNPQEDMEMFRTTCDNIRRYMAEIASLKSKRTGEAVAEIAKKRVEASLQFMVLKKLNRLEKFRTKASRDTLNKVKQQVDSYHLQLQNLLYEILHLKKEVTKCLQFKSKDEEIELVSEDEFFRNAPPQIAREDITRRDSHQLKLARLEWELEQRKQLAALCHKLQAEKETVAKDIQTKRERLENLTPRLKSILEVTKPLQDYLGLPLDKIRKQHQVAYLLPKPLYVLYVQTDAYSEACNRLMSVSVVGDEEEAKVLKESSSESSAVDDSDSEQEEPSESQRHHRKKSRSDRLEERKKKLLMKHPLSVEIVIKLKDGNSLCMNFHYLVNLHVVTVKTRVNLVQSVHGISAGDLIAPNNILMALFANDLGQDSPNISNHYQLQHLGLDSFSSYINDLGIPYIWAQRIAGLDFTGAPAAEVMDARGVYVEPKMTLSQTSVEGVMRTICHRLKARLALCRQMQSLETGMVPVPAPLLSNFPSKISCSLFSWRPIPWEDYKQNSHTQMLINAEMVTQSDNFYRAVITRGTAKLIALVSIKCNYPLSPPVFCLELQWHGDHTSCNNDAIRDMERELNVYWMELVQSCGWGQSLLVCQVMRLMACVDVYLESSGATSISPPEFPRDKIFIKPVKGRNRSRPYKYLQVGGGIFTQR